MVKAPAQASAGEGGEVSVVIDSKALFSIIGSEMDWEEGRMGSKFVFKSPSLPSLIRHLSSERTDVDGGRSEHQGTVWVRRVVHGLTSRLANRATTRMHRHHFSTLLRHGRGGRGSLRTRICGASWPVATCPRAM